MASDSATANGVPVCCIELFSSEILVPEVFGGSALRLEVPGGPGERGVGLHAAECVCTVVSGSRCFTSSRAVSGEDGVVVDTRTFP